MAARLPQKFGQLGGNDELRRFKTEIDLVRFAGTFGYDLASAERSGSYVRLRRGRGDQIIITRRPDGTYVWVNPANCEPRLPNEGTARRRARSRTEQGTIIDLLQRERPELTGNLGEVRKLLRRELSGGSVGASALPRPTPTVTDLKSQTEFDRSRVTLDFELGGIVDVSDYLLSRGLVAETQKSPRFAGTFRVRGGSEEVLFPHQDLEGITGFERKHPRYTLFATGGRRALWHSQRFANDLVLVIAESAIDCMSYQQLHPRENARYVSTGGTMSALQMELLKKAVADVPGDGLVVVATDDDFENPTNPGRRFAERIRQLTHEIKPELPCLTPLPYGEKDWNDVVRKRSE